MEELAILFSKTGAVGISVIAFSLERIASGLMA